MRYLSKIEKDKTEYWATRAIQEAPGRREPHIDLAKYYYETSNWQLCYDAAVAALDIKERPLEYLNEAESWGYAPHDLCAIAAYRLNNFTVAVEQGQLALDLCPPEERTRLSSNLSFYASSLNALSS
jgi:hypothetical protein